MEVKFHYSHRLEIPQEYYIKAESILVSSGEVSGMIRYEPRCIVIFKFPSIVEKMKYLLMYGDLVYV